MRKNLLQQMREPLVCRDEAIDRGLPRYWPDKPCKKGHMAMRRTVNGRCTTCETECDQNRVRKQSNFEPSNKMVAIDHLLEARAQRRELIDG